MKILKLIPRRALATLSLAAITLSAHTHAHAWNDFGHMVVAAIAYPQLTDTTRARVDALLKLNPDYAKWVDGVPDKDQGVTAFVMAARWPDAIKRNPDYTSDGADNGETPTDATASQNIGYGDHLRHKYWHYKDIPFSTDGSAVQDPKQPNVGTQIGEFKKTIASDTASDDLKSYDLAWLLHLTGDSHQPLHATSRFSSDLPQGDQGGNKQALCASPCKSELHAFWDDVLGRSEKPSAAIRAAAKKTLFVPPSDEQSQILDENTWLDESFEAAKSYAYAPPVNAGPSPYHLTPEYKAQAKKVARERVALAGARLANLLNTMLK